MVTRNRNPKPKLRRRSPVELTILGAGLIAGFIVGSMLITALGLGVYWLAKAVI